MKQSPIAKMLTGDFIEKNAIPSNVRYGTAIYNRGAVQFIENEDGHIEAWVGGLNGSVAEGGGSKRRVRFSLSNEGLKWNCTGNPKNHQIFCRHCVALALKVG
jgi:uncharacterized Zn finger protein